MINLKIIWLILYLLIAGGLGSAATYFISNSASASADATAVMNCKQPTRPVERSRHVDTVNSGLDKEY